MCFCFGSACCIDADSSDLVFFPRYEAGDHIAVYPANDTSLVNQLGEILSADLDTVISLNNLDGEYIKMPSLFMCFFVLKTDGAKHFSLFY